jgi:hypothetical protein
MIIYRDQTCKIYLSSSVFNLSFIDTWGNFGWKKLAAMIFLTTMIKETSELIIDIDD